METPAQTIGRLLGALEALTAEDNCLLEQGNFTEAAEVRQREQPLAAQVALLLQIPGVGSSLDVHTRTRLQSLIDKQSLQLERLSRLMQNTQSELAQIRSAQKRVQQIGPAYGGHQDTEPTTAFRGAA